MLTRLLPDYPDIGVEVIIDYGLADIVADRFDAGVRIGEQVDKDMIAVRIGPDFDMAVVGSPDYVARFGTADSPGDLVDHRCINLILGNGTRYRWNFRRGARSLHVAVEGPLAFNSIDPIRDAVLDGMGLGFLPLDQVEADIGQGRLVRLLDRWDTGLPGYHLYYPNRRFSSPAFKLLVDALRYRPGQRGA